MYLSKYKEYSDHNVSSPLETIKIAKFEFSTKSDLKNDIFIINGMFRFEVL